MGASACGGKADCGFALQRFILLNGRECVRREGWERKGGAKARETGEGSELKRWCDGEEAGGGSDVRTRIADI